MRRFFLSQPFTIYCLFLVVVVCVVSWVTTPHRHRPQDQEIVREYLPHIRQIPARPRVLGYSRARFGDGWEMQVTETGVCDTRHFLLVQTFGGSAGGCTSGNGDRSAAEREGVDPYTHHPMDRHNVDIDHIVPLAAAWDLGAYAWPEAQRRAFANDTQRNLVVTASEVNREKSDATLSEWLPPVDSCNYCARFVRVAGDYGLALTEADVQAAREACNL
ncbi:HNH endonuclease family protein [uncultured Corynebacterium sp.]|uniref:HNH endonuclease family protein n=1 Tax=uncultured Corynebacterium sp. TaxID=159447 RepID=UPI0025CCB1E7|nr:HNH endonuclease family protein [uncultured Corynebacterium sp.]